MGSAAQARGIGTWEHILPGCRRRQPGRYDLCQFWRGESYAGAGSMPEVLVRAHAFADVLEHVPLHVHDGERLAGSCASFSVHDLPTGISPRRFATALTTCRQRGKRDFQAGFDHACPDYPTLLALGIGGMRQRVQARLKQAPDQAEANTLGAFIVCLDGLTSLARRYALRHRCEGGCAELADLLEHVSIAPPRGFHEALQLLWLVHLAFVSEGRYAMALGRLDQILLPFYLADREAGHLERAGALDLLCHLWVKVEELGDVTNITIGGMTPTGADAVNDLSILCLKATQAVQSPRTNLSARLCDQTSTAFHEACFDCLRTGVGFPALFNDEILIPGLIANGIPAPMARDYCLVGCIETHLAGRQQAWGDGVPGFAGESTMQCLERALHRLHEDHETPSYAGLTERLRQEIRTFFGDSAQRVNAHIAKYPPERFPDPFLSVLTRDCIERARDINDGGAQFKRFYKCAGGGNLASLADSMAAVKLLVFDQGELSLADLIRALDTDFEAREGLRHRLLHRAPKYGNDDPYVDGIAAAMLDLILDEVEALPHVHGGGRFVACAAGNIHNIVRGRCVGATPDGRRAGEPLADATSPHFGRDTHGPTAVLRSMARTASNRVLGGRVANMRFDPSHFEGAEGRRLFSCLTHEMVRSRIQEIQVNFNSDATLKAAQESPGQYRDLVVRVSGFSAYFTQLSAEVQHDIMRRRAHA